MITRYCTSKLLTTNFNSSRLANIYKQATIRDYPERDIALTRRIQVNGTSCLQVRFLLNRLWKPPKIQHSEISEHGAKVCG